jgi:integrase
LLQAEVDAYVTFDASGDPLLSPEFLQARSPLSDPLQDAFGSGFEPFGPVQPLLGLRAVARLGLPVISLHDLRHTHATLLLRAGVPVKVVSERLGHANPAFTLTVYQHVIPGMQEEAASLF